MMQKPASSNNSFTLVPVNISNELAKLNQAILNPELYARLKQLAKDQPVYLRVKDFILTCNQSPEVPLEKIGLNKKTREYIYVNLVDPVMVSVYQVPSDRESSLAYLEFELSLQSPSATDFNIEDEKLEELLKAKLFNTFFKPKQVFYLTYNDVLLILTVTKSEIMQLGVKMQSESDGRLIKETEVKFRGKEGDKIKLKNEESASQNLFRSDFKLEDMGIGGLDKELINIFRRAFASRRFPPAIVARMGIEHVKGILLYGPPGTGKTLIARQLAKVLKAKELTIVNGPEIFSKYVGESEENIRKLFKKAREDEAALGDKSPLHVIVFDEIDAICKGRSGAGGAGSSN